MTGRDKGPPGKVERMLGQEMVLFLVATLVIGAVVFGGTTLVYFLDKHAKDSPRWESLRRLHDRVPVPAPEGYPGQRRDEAA
jgi:hypothetical protein